MFFSQKTCIYMKPAWKAFLKNDPLVFLLSFYSFVVRCLTCPVKKHNTITESDNNADRRRVLSLHNSLNMFNARKLQLFCNTSTNRIIDILKSLPNINGDHDRVEAVISHRLCKNLPEKMAIKNPWTNSDSDNKKQIMKAHRSIRKFKNGKYICNVEHRRFVLPHNHKCKSKTFALTLILILDST